MNYNLSERLEIFEAIDIVIGYDIFCGDIKDVVKRILELPKKVANEYTSYDGVPKEFIRLELDVIPDGYNEDVHVNLVGVYLETDEQFAARQEEIRMAEERKKQRAATKLKNKMNKDRAEFERLSKIFGNK